MTELTDNSAKVLKFLQDNPVMNLTDSELADMSGMPARATVGIVNTLVRKGLVHRELARVNNKNIKYVQLTDAGANYPIEE